MNPITDEDATIGYSVMSENRVPEPETLQQTPQMASTSMAAASTTQSGATPQQ